MVVVDDVELIFVRCQFAIDVLSRIWNWCAIVPPLFNTVREIIAFTTMLIEGIAVKTEGPSFHCVRFHLVHLEDEKQ